MKRRFITMMLITVLSVTCLAACGNSGNASTTAAADTDTTKAATTAATEDGSDAAISDEAPRLIGVALNEENAGDEKYVAYLTGEVGPALNMTFDFSEAITDTEGLITFIENEKSKGAVGIINQQPDGAEQGAALCDEYGMWMVNIESAMKESIKDIPHNAGSVGGSVAGIADVYAQAVNNILSDGEEHSVIIFSGAASYGAQSHVYSAMAILQAFQDAYGLTYDSEIRELAATSEVGAINTGNDNIKIYMVPGTDTTTAGTTISAQLQTGDYDIFVSVFAYSAFTGYVSEVESALNMDIKILATTPIKEETTKGFTTLDIFGNSTLTAAILNPVYENAGIAAFLIYQGLAGDIDKVKEDGLAVQYHVNQWLCEDVETYTAALQLNSGEGTYSISGQDLLDWSAEASVESLNGQINDLKDLRAILDKLNL